MPFEIQREIKAIINEEAIEYKWPKGKEIERLSEASLDDIWESSEDEHWDKFFKKDS
jgi:hypothetical protein